MCVNPSARVHGLHAYCLEATWHREAKKQRKSEWHHKCLPALDFVDGWCLEQVAVQTQSASKKQCESRRGLCPSACANTEFSLQHLAKQKVRHVSAWSVMDACMKGLV